VSIKHLVDPKGSVVGTETGAEAVCYCGEANDNGVGPAAGGPQRKGKFLLNGQVTFLLFFIFLLCVFPFLLEMVVSNY
jgi:hypothetical protein